jgi:prepilin-type processing-associated H-X9-DG protein
LVIDGVKHARVRSYSMNCFIAPAHTIGMWRHYTFASIESTGLTMPGSTWSFTDEHEDTIDDSSFLMLEEGNLDWFGLPTARHGKSTPFSFLDGHCETHRWVEPGTLAPVQRKRVVRTPAKPGDRDMFWIRNAASPVLMQ